MTANSGSSGGSSSSGSSSKVAEKNRVVPKPQSAAPAGAYLGSLSDGKSLVSAGGGNATIQGTNKSKTISLPSSTSSPATKSLVGASGGDGSATNPHPVDTTVRQTPSAEGPESTTITTSPRSDFSVVLAGQTGIRPNRSPAQSTNFVSLIGGAGGLGRRNANAKRTLIGGA